MKKIIPAFPPAILSLCGPPARTGMVILLWFLCLSGGFAQNPVSIHHAELERHLKLEKKGVNTEADWSLVSGFWEDPDTTSPFGWVPWAPGFRNLNVGRGGNWPQSELYAYHPFWMGNGWESYNLSAMDRILYFAYAVDPTTGESRNKMDTWAQTGLHDQAHAVESKVDLVVALYGEANLRTFLANEKAQKQLIQNVIALLADRGDGVNLDFQGLTQETKEQYLRFVRRFSLELKAVDVHYNFSITLPQEDPDLIFDFTGSKPLANRFLIMGYDAPGANKNRTGAVSLIGAEMEEVVKNYEQQGIPTHRMVLVLPWFGKEWRSSQKKLRVKADGPARILPLRYFQKKHGRVYEYDEFWRSAYSILPDNDDSDLWVHSWWDNSKSLSSKVDDVRNLKVKGIGVWCLGYDKSTGADETLIPYLPEDPVEAEEPGEEVEMGPPDLSEAISLKASHYLEPGRPLSYIDSVTEKTKNHFFWVKVDSFPPMIKSTDEEFLFLSPDVPLPLQPKYWDLIKFGLLFLGCFLFVGLAWPFSKFQIRKMIFVDHPLMAFLYLPLLAILLVVIGYGFGLKPETGLWSWMIGVGSVLVALIAAFIIVLVNRDVKEPEAERLKS